MSPFLLDVVTFSLRCCERVHFIWSSALTILFSLVCDVPAASVVSSYDEPFVFVCVHLNFFATDNELVEVKMTLPIENKTSFCASVQDVVVRNFRKSTRPQTYLQNQHQKNNQKQEI